MPERKKIVSDYFLAIHHNELMLLADENRTVAFRWSIWRKMPKTFRKEFRYSGQIKELHKRFLTKFYIDRNNYAANLQKRFKMNHKDAIKLALTLNAFDFLN